jgi:hypothetical protein
MTGLLAYMLQDVDTIGITVANEAWNGGNIAYIPDFWWELNMQCAPQTITTLNSLFPLLKLYFQGAPWASSCLVLSPGGCVYPGICS